MLLVNAVNTEGRPLEIFVKDGRIAAVGQELEALAGENETVIDAGGLTVLKELRATILAENKKHAEADRRIRDAAGMLENAVPHIAEWDESAIRQLVAQVKVLSKNEISVTLKSGIEIRQSISN